MPTVVVTEEEVYDERFGHLWWVFLVTGTPWLILSLAVFQFDVTSVNSIGSLAGIVFLIRALRVRDDLRRPRRLVEAAETRRLRSS